MKVSTLILRTIPEFSSRPRFFSLYSSTFSSNIKIEVANQVQIILDTVNPIEETLEDLVPFISTHIVTSVLQEQQNVQLGYRFFIWAMRRKHFRSWVSHNLMIDMLCGANGFELAWKVLEELRTCGIPIVSQAFTVLITAYAKLGMAEKAVESFGRMKEFDCRSNTFTYNTILHILVEKEVYLLALAVYNQMLKADCRPNRATFSILIDGLCKAGKTQDALQMFDEMAQGGISPNTMTYTIVISGLCQAKRIDDAHRLLHTMKYNSCDPDLITYTALLNGFCKLGRIDEALELLPLFRKEGFVLGLNGYSCLIDGLFRAGRYSEANEWYTKMSEENLVPDCIMYTIMIKGFSGVGKLGEAMKLLNEMTERGIVPDTFCYNTLIRGFCEVSLLDKAKSLHLEISKHDCFPDAATYTILICGLCREGLVGEAQQIFNEMEKLGCFPTIMTFNALIDGLCKAGELEEAHLLLYKMEIGRNPSLFLRLSQGTDRVLDSASLQTLVERLCESGLYLKAYKLLMQLADSMVLPDVITYNILINGFCKAQNINGAFKLFKELQLKGYVPDAVTYGTLIDGLQRVNREEDAFVVFDQMVRNQCAPSVAVYKTLMTSLCRNGKVLLAFSLWLKYVRDLPGREDGAVKVVEKLFEKGKVEEAVRGLLEMDIKCKAVDPSPYTIWLIGLCQAGRLDEALKIFCALEEYKIDVTPPSCVVLIFGLCQEGNLDMAIDIFLYTLKRGFALMPPVCNQLIRSLLHSQEKKNHAIDIVDRMSDAGYNMDVYLSQTTKALLRSPSATAEPRITTVFRCQEDVLFSHVVERIRRGRHNGSGQGAFAAEPPCGVPTILTPWVFNKFISLSLCNYHRWVAPVVRVELGKKLVQTLPLLSYAYSLRDFDLTIWLYFRPIKSLKQKIQIHSFVENQFLAFQSCKMTGRQSSKGPNSKAPEILSVAAACAIAATFVCPLDVIKTRLQVMDCTNCLAPVAKVL
ncbi:hypothetical protein HHK36_015819 [Tetracentron sinense]|uniref:Pentatricopeptide repeat-containing protein n=1 Tax=Tetracentron sinense TaxID=13715 RepID=A0A835DGK4_TETSI|nr:hypothetical protein HHK36_015819 [Tetracentron sinense]